MLITSTISCPDEFRLLEIEWAALLEESDSDSIFLTWEWLYTWWSRFGGNYQLNIITVRTQSNKLVGIAPFCVTSTWGDIPKNSICFLGAAGVSSEYLDIISNPTYRNEVAADIFDVLCAPSSMWGCIAISDILTTSLSYTIFKDIALSNDFDILEYPAETCPYLYLSEDASVTLSQLKGQIRSTIRRASKKLDRLNVRFTMTTNAQGLDAELRGLFELHQACWNERGEKGSFKDDVKKSFHLDIAQLLIKKDMLRLYALSVDDKRIAALYAFQFKDKLFYFQSGYDPKWKSYSPGTVLMWKCIEDATNRHLNEFDYLRGTEDYKALWANKSRDTRSVLLVPRKQTIIKIFILVRDIRRVATYQIKRVIKQLSLLLFRQKKY